MLSTKPDGWCEENEFAWLQEHSAGMPVVELGVHRGRSTQAFLKSPEIACVDAWFHDGAYESFCSTFQEYIDSKQISIYYTKDLYDLLDEQRLRLIAEWSQKAGFAYVDCGHAPHQVESDINLSKQLLRPGGILCGHDSRGGWSESVIQGLTLSGIKWRHAAGSIWVEDTE